MSIEIWSYIEKIEELNGIEGWKSCQIGSTAQVSDHACTTVNKGAYKTARGRWRQRAGGWPAKRPAPSDVATLSRPSGAKNDAVLADVADRSASIEANNTKTKTKTRQKHQSIPPRRNSRVVVNKKKKKAKIENEMTPIPSPTLWISLSLSKLQSQERNSPLTVLDCELPRERERGGEQRSDGEELPSTKREAIFISSSSGELVIERFAFRFPPHFSKLQKAKN